MICSLKQEMRDVCDTVIICTNFALLTKPVINRSSLRYLASD